jgi:hypothetical protein
MRSVRLLTDVAILAFLPASGAPARAQAAPDATTASVKTTYDVVKGYLTKAAAQVPEDKAAPAGDAEKLTTKAEIQKALADAFAICDWAFQAITAANANETVTLFGMTHTRIGALAFNTAHDFEHYGNIVTYRRINGMVPPSSGGGGN